MISRVLVALKPGYSSPSSIDRAKVLARSKPFDLLLYSAVHEDRVARSGFGTAEVLENIESSMLKSEFRLLENIKQGFVGLCNEITVCTQWQAPIARGLIKAAADFKADLIILNTSTLGRFQRKFLTNTDWDVIRHSKIPVLVSKEAQPKPYKIILAAVDPTHQYDTAEQLDDHVLELSKSMRSLSDAELYLGHVFPEAGSANLDVRLPLIDEFDDWQEWRAAVLEKFAERHGVDPEHLRRIFGSPANGIIDLAESMNVDLVVMGALSRTFRGDRVLGSAVESVLDTLDCDLLFVPMES